MKLKSLSIKIDNKEKRKVRFKDGLNLITNDKNVGRSGNSVGKSTLSRVIDYMLLGNISTVYIDDEYRKPNIEIESLFKNHDVRAELIFLDYYGRVHEAVRNLPIGKDEIFYIDGIEVSKNEYEEIMLNLIFDVNTKRPSLRIIAPKFIRNDSSRMLHTTKFLDRNASSRDYSELYLYLFGFNKTALLTKKREADNLAKRKKKVKESLNVLVRDKKPSNDIKAVKKKILELEKNILNIDFSPKIKNPIEVLHRIQREEDSLTSELFKINLKIDNINTTIEVLESQGGNYLVKELQQIYSFAGLAIDNVIKKYEESLAFHDNLVQRKKQYLESDLPELKNEYREVEEKIVIKQKEKVDVFSILRSKESVDKISIKIRELGDLKVSLGKLEGLIEQQSSSKTEYENAIKSLELILDEISKEIEVVESFELKFKEKLKSATKVTHDEEYEFSLNFDGISGVCKPEIINKVSNPEGGKKKAEVIAFDFSYIESIAELNIKRPRFVIHDSIEDIDQKQIEDIFALASTLPGQQIVSLLSDKFSDEMYNKYIADAVLVLSEEDMFFKV
ncbi:hypothetical protein VV869_16805 [Photobacterium sp. MCCC 1A19761]|uniref:hypothetical protein n=1 Tax=Photobacterium sp. MCCC 1A19761 TaxID=3115000 RepID=UPI00307ECFF7